MGVHLNAILILTNTGQRIAVKYYVNYTDKISLSEEENKQLETLRTVTGQKEFESNLVARITTDCPDMEKDIIIINDFNIVYRKCNVIIAVVGTKNCNEVILGSVQEAIITVLEEICVNITEGNLYEKLDLVFLLLDNIVDRGIIIQKDPKILLERIGSSSVKYSDHLPINQAIYTARNNIIKTLLSSS